VFIADYVLAGYGTGAVMGVPGHDERDNQFAHKYGIEIVEVVKKPEGFEGVYSGDGERINSGTLDGLKQDEAIQKMNAFLVQNKCGNPSVHYKLRDWVFSRQRYWGEPIPVIHCATHGQVAVPEKDLPVKLPEVKKYETTQTGESPLALIDKWVNTKCPICKGPAKRETDTMPQWAGSSWYFIRYIDPKNSKAFADPKKIKKWLPVNWYNGGMEHTTLHLLYSRFWYKFLFDQKLVPTSEPYAKRTSHGLILAEGGAKMSKSKGNVVNPDDAVKLYGADTLRLYEMFMGPFDQPVAWNTESMIGPRRFVERVWNLQNRLTTDKKVLGVEYKGLVSDLHKTIEKVSGDIEKLGFNTAVSAMMTLLNRFEKEQSILKNEYELFMLLVAPFAPHVSEEIWANLGYKKSVHLEKWPKSNKKLILEDKINIAVQVNGKLRATIEVNTLEEADVVAEAKNNENVKKYLEGVELVKTIYVRGKIVNFVVKQA
jgi:leucyl-tRNA synthetase